MSQKHFTNNFEHHVSLNQNGREAVKVIVETAPAAFAKLRNLSNCTTELLASELLIDTLPLQANKRLEYNSNGTVKGESVPSQSGKFLISTIPSCEAEDIQSFLPQYLEYLSENSDTLLCRVLGLYKVSESIFRDYYVIILFNPVYVDDTHFFDAPDVYRLQGGYRGPVLPPSPQHPNVFFDANSERKFSFRDQLRSLRLRIQQDVKFLRENGRVGYELVVVAGCVKKANKEESPDSHSTRLVQESLSGDCNYLSGIYNVFGRERGTLFLSSFLQSSAVDASATAFAQIIQDRLE